MMKKYFLPILLLAGSLNANAQLEYGYNYVPEPEDMPSIYFDMLREKYPYILHQHRQNLNGNNWQDYRQMHTLKTPNGHYRKLGIDRWSTSNQAWENERSFDYTITMGSGNKFDNIVTERNSDVDPDVPIYRMKFTYDGQNNIIKIVVDQDVNKNGTYTPFNERFITYDQQNRKVYDSTAYANGKNVKTYTYSGDTIIYADIVYEMQFFTYQSAYTIYKDKAGKVVGRVTKNTFDGNISSDSTTISYDAGGRVSLYEYRYKNATGALEWSALQKIEHQYRSDGEPSGWISSIQNRNDSTLFSTDYKLEITYKGNKADSAFAYFAQGSGFDTRAQQRYIFSQVGLNIADKGKKMEALNVYPNPARDELFIATDMTGNKYIRIYDVSGRLIQTENTSGNKISINTLPEGHYFMTINNDLPIRFQKQ